MLSKELLSTSIQWVKYKFKDSPLNDFCDKNLWANKDNNKTNGSESQSKLVGNENPMKSHIPE